MRTPTLPGFAFLALVAVLLPLPWHWRARNVATIAIIIWLALANITLFVNCIVWDRRYADVAPVWCDISIRAPQVLIYAIPSCSLSQMRRLEAVASVRFTSLSRRQRVYRAYIELGLCVAFPLAMLAVFYIVQESRYALVEDVGCVFPTYVSWPSIIIANVIPSALSIASLVYSGLAIRWFIRRRMEFQKILSSNSPSLNTGRYLRLIAFAVIDVLFSIGANVFALAWVLSAIKPAPWKGLAYTHEDFSTISQYSTPSGNFKWEFMMSLYVPPLYSFLFFIFFGFGEEAIKEYQRAWNFLLKMLPTLFTTHQVAKGKLSQMPHHQRPARTSPLNSRNVTSKADDLELSVRNRDEALEPAMFPAGPRPQCPVTVETTAHHSMV